jgi:hypothetical protein
VGQVFRLPRPDSSGRSLDLDQTRLRCQTPDNRCGIPAVTRHDADILMLARMYGRRLKGYADMGYKVLSDAQRRLISGKLRCSNARLLQERYNLR